MNGTATKTTQFEAARTRTTGPADPSPVAAGALSPAAAAPSVSRPNSAEAGATTMTVGQAVEAARHGDADAMARLSDLLDQRPDLVQRYGDLALVVQQAWVKAVACGNFLMQASTMRRLEALKRELGGDHPTPLEKLLVERLTAAWVQAEHADLMAAMPQEGEGIKTALFKAKRQTMAQQRFLAAARTLAMVQRLNTGITVEVKRVGAAAGAVPQAVAESAAVGAIGGAEPHKVNGNGANGHRFGGRLGSLLHEPELEAVAEGAAT